MTPKRVLLVGGGGIGALVAQFLAKAKESLPLDITVLDFDTVEKKNLTYQNFSKEDVGKNKARVLAARYGLRARPEKLTSAAQLKGYDLVVLAVDNHEARKVVWRSGADWVDLRAEKWASEAYIKSKDNTYARMLKTTGQDDPLRAHCQNAADIERGWLHLGHAVAAAAGAQLVLNKLRGAPSRDAYLWLLN